MGNDGGRRGHAIGHWRALIKLRRGRVDDCLTAGKDAKVWVVLRRNVWFKSLATGAVVVAMSGCATLESNRQASAVENQAKAAEPTLFLSRGDWPTELASDVEWQAAATGDEWSLLAIARHRQLLGQHVERGGPAAKVALHAWALAPEAWAERGTLCQVLPKYETEAWPDLLRALRLSADKRDAYGEVLDPNAAETCAQALAVIQPKLTTTAAHDEYAAACQSLECSVASPP